MKEQKFKLNDKVYITDTTFIKGADYFDIFNRKPVIVCGKITKIMQTVESDDWWYDITYNGGNNTRYELNEFYIYMSKKEALDALVKEFEEYCIKIKKILGIKNK
jgi:hypothetical protein